MALAVLLCVVTQVSPDCPLTFLTPLLINTLLHFLPVWGNALSFKAHPLIKISIVCLFVGQTSIQYNCDTFFAYLKDN